MVRQWPPRPPTTSVGYGAADTDAAAQGGAMPLRPAYSIRPGDRLEVVQPNGDRALVIGKLDAVPESAGGRALRIRVCDARVTPLAAE